MVAALIDDIPAAQELVDRIMREADEIIRVQLDAVGGGVSTTAGRASRTG